MCSSPSDPGRTRARFHALVIVALLALGAASVVSGEEVVAGQVYAGGTRLEVSELGVAFTVPAGWRGAWPPGSEMFRLQPETDPNTNIFGLGDEGSRADLTAMMAAPINLGGGISLYPTGSVGERGQALTGRYQVQGAPAPLVAYAEAVAAPSGIAVAYILISSEASIGGYEAAVQQLIDSTTLGSPAAGAAADAAPSTGVAPSAGSGASERWDTYLKGKYIVRYFTATGYTDETHLWLCSNGSFQRQGAAGSFGGGASGAFQGDSTGTWTAMGAGEHGTLTLQYGDGSAVDYQLRWDYAENHLYVDDKRWYHDTNEVCN